jgi:CHC2-type zinc finger protein
VKSDHARRMLAFQELKRALPPLTALLEHYGLLADMKPIGSQLFSNCPIHNGSSRKQFVVNPATSEWKCFSPAHDKGGSTIEFVMAMQNCNFQEATAHLARWFAIGTSNPVHSQPQQRSSVMSESNQPTHRVYSAKRREGADKDDLTPIGSGWVFNTKAGKAGMNIVLSAMPIGDRIVVFERDPEWEAKHKREADEPEPKENGNVKSFGKKK